LEGDCSLEEAWRETILVGGDVLILRDALVSVAIVVSEKVVETVVVLSEDGAPPDGDVLVAEFCKHDVVPGVIVCEPGCQLPFPSAPIRAYIYENPIGKARVCLIGIPF